MSAMIEVHGIYKIFGTDPARVLPLVREGMSKEACLEETGHTVGLNDVSMTMERGKTSVVMGLSGSGKSTLIRHVNRLIDPTAGKIYVDGTDVLTLSKSELMEFRRHKLSMVFQRFGLMPHKSVLQNVGYGLEVQGIDEKRRTASAMEQIEIVGLKGFEHQYPAQLSGGMQQRVGLARALATNPEILLMDEAFSALDPLIRSGMQQQLIELQRTLNKTIMFITHDLDEALRLGDQIAILNDGQLVQCGPPEEIILSPADDYVREFVKDVNKGKAIRAETIMVKVEDYPSEEHELATLPRVRGDEIVNALLPVMLESKKPVAVLDNADTIVGVVTERALAATLSNE